MGSYKTFLPGDRVKFVKQFVNSYLIGVELIKGEVLSVHYNWPPGIYYEVEINDGEFNMVPWTNIWFDDEY